MSSGFGSVLMYVVPAVHDYNCVVEWDTDFDNFTGCYDYDCTGDCTGLSWTVLIVLIMIKVRMGNRLHIFLLSFVCMMFNRQHLVLFDN